MIRPLFIFLLMNVYAASAAFAELSPSAYNDKILEAASIERGAALDRATAEGHRLRAKGYAELADKNRKDAEAYSKKMPQNFWKISAQKAREDAESYQKEADRFTQEAEALEKETAEKISQAEKIRAEAEAGKPTAAPPKKEEPPPSKPPVAEPSVPVPPSKTGSAREERREEVPVEELVGQWYHAASDSKVTIDFLYHKEKKHELSLKGKYSWGGIYEKGTIVFTRTPYTDEMSGAIPEWAREMVAEKGNLRWRLELKPTQTCPTSELTGFWYPGEVQWNLRRDPKTGETIQKEASPTGEKGEPIKMLFEKIEVTREEEKVLEGEIDILVNLSGQPSADTHEQHLVSLTRYEPFVIEVLMDQQQAEKTGRALTVDLKAVKSGLTSSVELKKQRTIHGVVHYVNPKPVKLARTDILPDSEEPDLWYDFLGRIKNGDDLEIRYLDKVLTLKIYDSHVQQGIAQGKDGLDALEKILQAKMEEPGLAAAQKEIEDSKLRMIANARRFLSHEPGPKEAYTDLTRLQIVETYLGLLEEPPVNWEKRSRGTRDRNYHAVWVWDKEREYVLLAIEQAGEEYKDQVLKLVGQLSVNLFQVTIGNSIGGKFIVVVWGIDAAGNLVNKTDRFFAGLEMISQGVLSSARSIQKLQSLRTAGTVFTRTSKAARVIRAGNTSGAPQIALRPADIHQTTIRAYPGEINFEAPVKVSPLNSQGTPIQIVNNTCGLNVVTGIRRDMGMEFIGEFKALRVAKQKGWYELGQLRNGKLVGGGMTPEGMARCLKWNGGEAGITRHAPFATDIQRWLRDDRKIVSIINVGTPENPAYHWSRIEGMKCSRATREPRVVFGDPWNGSSWEMSYSVFRRRMVPAGTVVVEFPPD